MSTGKRAMKNMMVMHCLETQQTTILVPPPEVVRPHDATRGYEAHCPVAHDEKNWSPMVSADGHLEFVYHHHPLQVLRFIPGVSENTTAHQRGKRRSEASRWSSGSMSGSLVWVHRAVHGAEQNASSPSAGSAPPDADHLTEHPDGSALASPSCASVRGGSAYMPWGLPGGRRARYQVALGHAVCDAPNCTGLGWYSRDDHCSGYCPTPRLLPSLGKSNARVSSSKTSCSRLYRSVLTVLDTQTWRLRCSSPLTFEPPPFWQCTQGWRGKWDVQYVHSLVIVNDSVLVGVEFENRCPAVARVALAEFEVLIYDTLFAGKLPSGRV